MHATDSLGELLKRARALPAANTQHEFWKTIMTAEGVADFEVNRWWLDLAIADYSWDGLKNKKLSKIDVEDGQIDITLSDLFMGEEKKLITAPNGKKYTAFHLPFIVHDGKQFVETEKVRWGEAEWSDVESRLESVSGRFVATIDHSQNKYTSIVGVFDGSKKGHPTKIEYSVSLDGMSLRRAAKFVDQRGQTNLNSFINFCYFSEAYVSEYGSLISRINKCLFARGLILLSNDSEFKIRNSVVNQSIVCNHFNKIDKFEIIDCVVGRIELNNCTIESLRIKAKIINAYECEFYDTLLIGADFTGSGWAIMAGFDRTEFKKDLKLDTAIVGFHADTYFKDFILNPILRKYPLTPFYEKWRITPMTQHAAINAREAALHRLEGAVINLKKHYKELWLEELSNRFYRFELRARENSPSAKGRLLSKCYRWLSDYGYDLWRPLMWIGILCCSLSLAYYALYLSGTGRSVSFRFGAALDPKFWDAISFSWGRIAPIIPWDIKDQAMSKDALPAVMHGGNLIGLTAHIVAITQTFLSTGLIFLFGLAARRRFRIAD